VWALLGASLSCWFTLTQARPSAAVATGQTVQVGSLPEPAPLAIASRGPTVPQPLPLASARVVPGAPPVAAELAAQRTRMLLTAIGELVRRHLFEPRSAAALRDCKPLSAPACRGLLSDALYEVLGQYVEPAIELSQIDLAQLDRAESAAIRMAAVDRIAQSADPIDRVSALVLLDRAAQLEAGPLPDAAFVALADKPVVEAQLLLTYSRHGGLPSAAVVAEVAALAGGADVDMRVQGPALATLARPETAAELNAAVRALADNRPPDWSGWNDHVAPALARCGMACAERSVEIVARAHDPVPIASHIVRRSQPADRRALLDRLAPALPDGVLHAIHEGVDL
jgi:hypothetical protein